MLIHIASMLVSAIAHILSMKMKFIAKYFKLDRLDKFELLADCSAKINILFDGLIEELENAKNKTNEFYELCKSRKISFIKARIGVLKADLKVLKNTIKLIWKVLFVEMEGIV